MGVVGQFERWSLNDTIRAATMSVLIATSRHSRSPGQKPQRASAGPRPPVSEFMPYAVDLRPSITWLKTITRKRTR